MACTTVFIAAAAVVSGIMRISRARLAITTISLLVSLGAFADQSGAFEGAIRQLRFSPDGNYVLAQTDSEIAVAVGSTVRQTRTSS